MNRHLRSLCVVGSAFGLLVACAGFSAFAADDKFWSTDDRLSALKRAQVWHPTDVASMNMRVGPAGPEAFAPNSTVTCEYKAAELGGRTPKFACVLTPADELKVKYGAENGEVFAEVAATRLLWALGFAADRMYPVRVNCTNCPRDPHASDKVREPRVVFDPAAIERKFRGEAIETKDGSGWAWPELDLVQESDGGAPYAHRDALKLLAVFLQHSDSKPEQQRLVCLDPPGDKPTGTSGKGAGCTQTMMVVQDLGITFGKANLFNRNEPGSVNFEEWSKTPIWHHKERCIGELAMSQTGSLDNPLITEPGRKFLADLLMKLTDRQLRDLFTVARFPERKTEKVRAASVDEWVGAFKAKRAEIVNRHCGA